MVFRMLPTHTALNRLNVNDWVDEFLSPSHAFKMDVMQKDEAYTITADLPGIKKDQLTISYDNERLTIEVTAHEEQEQETKNYIHKERRHVNMKRAIYLVDIDDKNIKARLEDGVLTVQVPKKMPVETRVLIDVE